MRDRNRSSEACVDKKKSFRVEVEDQDWVGNQKVDTESPV
jgi:hypothetical protein